MTVIAIIAVGSDYPTNRQVLEIAEKYRGFVYPALGFHPMMLEASQIRQNLEFIKDHLTKAWGIGEVGLDYHKRVIGKAPKELQKSVLREILTIARKQRKPVIIHSRYAWRDALALVEEAKVEKAVFHWYSGPSSVLKDIMSRGYFISATPATEYHQEHRRAVRAVSIENLLIETDSPVSYGIGLRWQAEPPDAVRTLKAVAEVREISQQELARITTNNAIRFFDLPLTGKGETGIIYVTSRKWEEEVQEKSSQEKEEMNVVVSSFANPPLQKDVGVASEDRVIEDSETRQNMGPTDAVRMMRAKLQTEEGKEIYRQRKKIVGPVFGQVKFNLGSRRFRLRGVDKADGEWALVCLVHNIKKIYARIMAKGDELDDLTGELQVAYNPA